MTNCSIQSWKKIIAIFVLIAFVPTSAGARPQAAPTPKATKKGVFSQATVLDISPNAPAKKTPGGFKPAAVPPPLVYDFDIASSTALPTVQGLTPVAVSEPSINNNGLISFTAAYQSGGRNVIVLSNPDQGTYPIHHLKGAPYRSSNFTQVNDNNQVAFQDRTDDLAFTGAYRFNTAAGGDVIGEGSINPSFPKAFLVILPRPALNNLGLVVFSTFDGLQTSLASRNGGSGSHNVAPVGVPGQVDLYPVVSDYGENVVRMGGAATSPLYYSPSENYAGFGAFASTANTANIATKFTALGQKPGISDDGFMIAFMGDHRTLGKGVFVYAYSEATQQFYGPVRITGLLPAVSLDSKVGVNRVGNTANFAVTFLAVDADNQLTLYSQHINAFDPQSLTPVSFNTVTRQGAVLGNSGFTVRDIKIYDPVNTKGQMAFWTLLESTQTTGTFRQAVVRATAQGTGGAGGPLAQNPNLNSADCADPVYLHSGQFHHECVDLQVPGRGMDFVLKHNFRGAAVINGQYGYGWSINYHERLSEAANGNVTINDGTSRVDVYTKSGGVYTSPAGFYQTLVKNGDGTWVLTESDGTKKSYAANGTLSRIEDRNGNAITLQYDLRGLLPITGLARGAVQRGEVGRDYRLIGIDDTIGHHYTLTYNTNGLLSNVIDYAGRQLSFDYDLVTNDLLKITKPATLQFPGGVTKTFTYQNHNVLTITDGRGQTFVTNRYDAQNRVYEQDWGEGTMRFVYENLKTTVTDRNGNITVYEFDAAGHPTKTTQQTRGLRVGEPVNFITTNVYNTHGELISVTYPRGSGIKYIYDDTNPDARAKGNLLSMRRKSVMALPDNDAVDLVTSYTYEPRFNQVKTMTDARGNITTYTYDYELPFNDPRYAQKGNLVRIEQPTVNSQTPTVWMRYNTYGQLTEVQDPENHITQYAYYPATGYVNSITRDPSGVNAITQFVYDSYGNVTTVTDANGHEKRFKYNELNWLIESSVQQGTVPPQFPVTKYTYDANGNVLKIEHQVNGYLTVWQTTIFTYTKLNQVKTMTDPINRVTTYEYDLNQNLKSVTDHLTRKTSFVYDERDLLWTKTDANIPAGVTKYTYDANGNLKEILDANSISTKYLYDAFDRLQRETFADTMYHEMTYDKNGNVLTHRTPGGFIITFIYDALNRAQTKQYMSAAALNVTYGYDLASRLTSANTTAANNTFTYDALNRVKTNTQTLNAVPYTLTYDYDKAGNRTRLVYPNGRALTYEYYSNDRIMRIAVASGGAGTFPLMVTYNYDPLERLINRSSLGSRWAHSDNTYDMANQLLKKENRFIVSMQLGAGGTVWEPGSMYEYTYDGVGNRQTMKQTLPQDVKNYTYGYNPIYELTSVSGAQTHTFNYDGVGNRTTADGVSYTKNNLNQYSAVGVNNLTYDTNANLASYAGASFTYDEDNRMLTAAKPSVSAQYNYDGLNRRIKRTVTGTGANTTYFIYDGDRVIEERDAAGQIVAEYAWGPGPDELLWIYKGGQKYNVLADGLGNITDIVNDAGTVVERFTYDVYGQPDHVSTITPYLFTGQRFDSESGLYYYKARMYHPGLGRFMQRDPIGYFDSMNLYSYVGNNPASYIDPLGLYSYETTNVGMAFIHESNPFNADSAMRQQMNSWLKFYTGDLPGAAAVSGQSIVDKSTEGVCSGGISMSDWQIAYNASQIIAGVAAGTAIAAGTGAIPNYSFRIGIDPANHPFKYFGKVKHIQMDRWLKGVKGSDKNIFRIPIPWWK